MDHAKIFGKIRNIGFISTRFAGTDGVSLETKKWADVLQKEGYHCYYFAGELDRLPQICYYLPEAQFSHPNIQEIYQHCFANTVRDRAVTEKIHETTRYLKDHLYRFLE